jgi:hypothetical protein
VQEHPPAPHASAGLEKDVNEPLGGIQQRETCT